MAESGRAGLTYDVITGARGRGRPCQRQQDGDAPERKRDHDDNNINYFYDHHDDGARDAQDARESPPPARSLRIRSREPYGLSRQIRQLRA